MAWRRLKPSVLLSDRKDETELVRTRITQGMLSEERDRVDILLCVLMQKYIKLWDAIIRKLLSETETELVVARG